MPDSISFAEADITVDETVGTVSVPLVRTGDLVDPVTVTYDITGAMIEFGG